MKRGSETHDAATSVAGKAVLVVFGIIFLTAAVGTAAMASRIGAGWVFVVVPVGIGIAGVLQIGNALRRRKGEDVGGHGFAGGDRTEACAYCGRVLADETEACPGCGAPRG